MALRSFNDWKKLVESRDEELKCPHPEDSEFCRKWNLYMRGDGPMPVYQGRSSIGHYTGPRAGQMRTKRDKQRQGSGRKGGRYDWRKDS